MEQLKARTGFGVFSVVDWICDYVGWALAGSSLET